MSSLLLLFGRWEVLGMLLVLLMGLRMRLPRAVGICFCLLLPSKRECSTTQSSRCGRGTVGSRVGSGGACHDDS